MKKYLIILLTISTAARAQYVSNYKQVADRFYAKGDYYSAAHYYEQYIAGKSPGRSGYSPYQLQKQGTRIGPMHKLPASLVYKIADSYYHLNNFTQAEPWYKMLVDKYNTEYPQARCWYATCLRAKGDYMAALEQLEKFLLSYRVYDQYSEQVHQELDICLFIRKQMNNPVAGISVEKLNNPIDTVKINTPVLNDNNARQLQITADGKYLLFASDRPGGLGGYDIWYAELDNQGRATNITNMGPAINTAADEAAPFYHAPTNTLVFASKGRIGMGGFDLFTATGSFTTSWAAAVNMGYPVNSVKDDAYFISRGAGLLEDAIISSDRSSTCCLELYSVHKSQINTVAGR